MLLHIPNVLTPDELQFCRAMVESAAWADGAITAGTQSGQVKNNRQLPEDLPESIRAREVVLAALKRNALFFSAALPKKIYPPLFNRYDGGELVMDEFFGEQRIKLPAGDMILYPSSSVHRVEPVTRGSRICMFTWLESLVRATEQRRVLFDLDLSIVGLRGEAQDGADLVRLTGCYHNLLRMWADS